MVVDAVDRHFQIDDGFVGGDVFEEVDGVEGDIENCPWMIVEKVQGQVIAKSNPEFIRPMKTNELRVDPAALDCTEEIFGWRARTHGDALIQKMLQPLDDSVEQAEFDSFV